MNTSVCRFGTVDGEPVTRYTLQNTEGMRVDILSLGGIIQNISVPDKAGQTHHCINGFDDVETYLSDESYQGALVGRYANRIGNGVFSLDGVGYQVDVNGGPHHLHGGFNGFNKRLWHSQLFTEKQAVGVRLTLTSPDGDAGFPGELTVTAEYRLYAQNRLTLTLRAETTAVTPFSMTQHAYFHLGRRGPVTDAFLQLNADSITEIDSTLLPTGKVVGVSGTPFDYTSLTRIGDNIGNAHPQFDVIGGYDHNFVLRRHEGAADAILYAPDTGIRMALRTSFPGLQVYTGALTSDASPATICLEPQFFPDSPNQPAFPDCTVRPGTPFQASIEYAFSTV